VAGAETARGARTGVPQAGTEGDGEEIASAPGTGDYFFPPSNSHMPRASTQRAFNFSQIWRPDVGDPG